MSKKLFALLAALSAIGFYGCDSDDSGCTEGVKRCGTTGVELCVNGDWKVTLQCAAGCEEKNGEPACKTSGGSQGGGTQGGNEGGTQGGSTDPSVGSTCDATTFTPKCINSNANALVCKNGTVQQWTCAGSVCTVSGSNVDCPKADSGSGTTTCTNPVTTGGNVGDCCDKNTYQQTCINGNGNALVCWNDKVTQWECTDKNCAPDQTQPLKVVCTKGSTGGGTELADCAMTKDASCEKCKASESTDGTKGYYCDTKSNVIREINCGTGKVSIDYEQYQGAGKVTCTGGENCTESSTSYCKPACTEDKSKGYYWSSQSNSVKTEDCSTSNDCYLNDQGYVKCKSAESGT